MEDSVQQVSVTPVAVVVLVAMMYFTWSLPRRFAICPLLIMTCLMPLGQELDLGGMHFHLFRVLLMVGLARVVTKGEFARMQWTRTDKVFVWWSVVTVVLGSLSTPSTELLINRLGMVYNAVGVYFFARCVLVDFEDVVTSVRTLAWVSLPLAALMQVEKLTDHNPFAMFGGVPELSYIRNGHVRCSGAFRHAILAGTFGATLIPLLVAFGMYERKNRLLAIFATLASVFITIAASSSGALAAFIAGMGGLALWKFRKHMRWVRRGAVALLIVMTMIMNAPVWYVFARLSSVSGGEGWHRAYLIDQAVKHFDEWYLFGTTYTAHWGPGGAVVASDPNMMDITNEYILEGISGGILKLVLFMVIIVGCFKIIGRRLRDGLEETTAGFFIWAIGVTLFAHCLSFMSVTYFDQIIVIWFWLLAVIGCIECLPAPELESVETEGELAEDELHGNTGFGRSWKLQNE